MIPASDGDALVWRTSRPKAVTRLVVGGAFGLLGVLLAHDTPRQGAGWTGVFLVAVLAGWSLWTGLESLVSGRTLTVSRRGLAVTGWFPRTVAWSDVERISVLNTRGAQMMIIALREGVPGRRAMVSFGWEASPYVMHRQIERARARWEGRVPDPEIVPPGAELEDGDAPPNRTQGMLLTAAGGVCGFAAMFAPHTPGPGPLAITLAVVSLMLGLGGLARWFWPTGRRAVPPIFSTFPEYIVFGLSLLGVMLAGLGLHDVLGL